METHEVLFAIVTLDYATIRTAIEMGFNFNQPISGKRPLVEAAQPAKDPTMLRLLWEAGVTPTTPWLEQVFAALERNEGTLFLDRHDIPTVQNLSQRDLTHNFSVEGLNFTSGSLTFRGKQSAIEIPVSPFILDGQDVKTSIWLEEINFPSDPEHLANHQFQFPINPEEGYIDGSIYLRNVHNSIDVTSITFGDRVSDQKYIVARIAFKFLFDGIGFQNQSVTREIELEII